MENSRYPLFYITYMTINIYYPGEPVNILIQSIINIIQENNWVVTPKKGKGKLPLFCCNGDRVNPIYGKGWSSVGGSRGKILTRDPAHHLLGPQRRNRLMPPRKIHPHPLLLPARKMIVPRGTMTYPSLPKRRF